MLRILASIVSFMLLVSLVQAQAMQENPANLDGSDCPSSQYLEEYDACECQKPYIVADLGGITAARLGSGEKSQCVKFRNCWDLQKVEILTPALSCFSCCDCRELTTVTFCPENNIQNICFAGCTSLTKEVVFSAISTCQKLQQVDLRETSITSEQVAELREAYPAVTILFELEDRSSTGFEDVTLPLQPVPSTVQGLNLSSLVGLQDGEAGLGGTRKRE